jgi:hypothetical protein
LGQANHKGLVLNITSNNTKYNEEIKLFPYYGTRLITVNNQIDLYAGEEKTIEIPAINSSNIKVKPSWTITTDYDYLVTADENSLKVQIRPNTIGNKELVLNLKTITPFLNSKNKMSYGLEPYKIHFSVKPSRLNFINVDKNDFFFDDKIDDVGEVQLDHKAGLEIGKAYRVESRLESGGKLVAEIYIKSVLGDNKLLCGLRPYSYHNVNEGYLYIKQGNNAKYITNFNTLPKPSIEKVSVLHESEDWSSTAMVYPGESAQVKIEGKGLSKSKFDFSGCVNVKQDSTRIFDDVIFYSISVPSDFNKKTVYIEMNKNKTKYELVVKENQRPRDFDFVSVNYGSNNVILTSPVLNTPVIEPHALNAVSISFDRSMIDDKDFIYGKQYLDFEFKLYNNKNDLIEDQKLENIAICPDQTSIRGCFYDQKDCFKSIINVNDYLLHKTYDLDGWSKIEIIVKHTVSKYSDPGYSRRIIIIKQKLRSLDLQASFPTGLLTKSLKTKGVAELSGFSVAFLAQLSFYDKDGIQKIKPYKVGVGFIALNIFNLTSSSQQPDIGAVVIGSILPLKPKSKFNFPLYLGFGYQLRSGEWFTLLGPGVQFNF